MFNALSYLATIVFFQIWSRGSRTVQEILILNGLNAPRDKVEQNFLISKFWLYLQTINRQAETGVIPQVLR